MFGFFHFQGASIFNGEVFNVIDGIVDNIFQNINVSDLYEEDNEENETSHSEEESKFISLESFNDMYILSINLKGIDLKELSIQYENNTIEINVDRTEQINYGFIRNNFIKKHYNKLFDNIEDIDTDRLFKSIDNGYLMITMPKKYIINDGTVIDTDYIEIND